MNILTRTCCCEKQTTVHRCQAPDSGTNRPRPHSRGRVRTLLQRRTANRIRTPSRTAGGGELLARVFGHPQGAGFIGPGADGLLRAILAEALTSKIGISWVISTRHDLDALCSGPLEEALLAKFSSRLHVTETLEDAIEHLEFESNVIGALKASHHPAFASSPVLWFSSPGPDADVVHQTLQRWPGSNLIALISGGWPYGPTHLVDHDGPRTLPQRPINLLSAQQAVNELRISNPLT